MTEAQAFQDFVSAALSRPLMYGVETPRDFALLVNGYTCALPGTAHKLWQGFLRFVNAKLGNKNSSLDALYAQALTLDEIKADWNEWLELPE